MAAPVLYIVSMMHAEESAKFDTNAALFNNAAGSLEKLGALFHAHSARIDFGPDHTFLEGVCNFNQSVLTSHLAKGHGIQTHAHEHKVDLGGVHALDLKAGANSVVVANGGFGPPYGADGWVKHVAGFKNSDGTPMFTTAIGYKNPQTQIPDGHGTCFRPSATGDWTVPDPSGPLLYFGSNTDEVAHGGVLDFATVRSWIDDRLSKVQAGHMNTLYWHDSLHNYLDTAKAHTRIAQWEKELVEYFDPLVAEGRLQWANFAEMTKICLQHETSSVPSVAV